MRAVDQPFQLRRSPAGAAGPSCCRGGTGSASAAKLDGDWSPTQRERGGPRDTMWGFATTARFRRRAPSSGQSILSTTTRHQKHHHEVVLIPAHVESSESTRSDWLWLRVRAHSRARIPRRRVARPTSPGGRTWPRASSPCAASPTRRPGSPPRGPASCRNPSLRVRFRVVRGGGDTRGRERASVGPSGEQEASGREGARGLEAGTGGRFHRGLPDCAQGGVRFGLQVTVIYLPLPERLKIPHPHLL